MSTDYWILDKLPTPYSTIIANFLRIPMHGGTPWVMNFESRLSYDMASLLIRPTRFDLNVGHSFKTDDGIVEGHCVNVSSSGMLAIFSRAIDLFTVGELSFEVGEHFVNITARVARVQSGDHGLSFQIDNDSDRDTIQVLVNYAASMHQPD